MTLLMFLVVCVLQLSQVDCRDALEMICNLEAEEDERAAFTLCSGFLTRQLLQEDSYCAWSVPKHPFGLVFKDSEIFSSINKFGIDQAPLVKVLKCKCGHRVRSWFSLLFMAIGAA